MMAHLSTLPPSACGETSVDRYFAAGGARLRYRDTGAGPALLMIHGWTLDLEMWEPQVRALQDAFRIVRLDRRGFGLSSGRPGAEQDIADALALCEHLDIRRTGIVGMSQGARAALGVARAAPQMISCLILDGPPGEAAPGSAADDGVPLDHYRALMRTQGIAAVRREWSMHPLVSLRTGDPRMHQLLHSMLMRYPGNDLMEPAATDGAVEPVSPLDSMAAPVLIITGEHDLASRTRAANTLAGQLPGATRALIPGAGHLPNFDNPEVYDALVRAFLERHAISLR